MRTFVRSDGIQEVSGSIPLISTKGYVKRPVFIRKQAFSLSLGKIARSNTDLQQHPGGTPMAPLGYFKGLHNKSYS